MPFNGWRIGRALCVAFGLLAGGLAPSKACFDAGPAPPSMVSLLSGPAAAFAAEPDTLVSPWGKPVQGLRIRFLADTTLVSRNAILGVQVQFQFLPKKAPKGLTTLLHHPLAGVSGLEFRDKKSGTIYRRFRTPPGYEETISPADYFDLKGILIPQDLSVRLVSPEGEAIPPGNYEITATYANEKALELNAHSRNYGSGLWSGVARSAPVAFKLPGVPPQTVSFTAYDSATAIADLPVVNWKWSVATRRRVQVEARPGYAVGHQEKVVLLFPSSERDLLMDVTGAIDVRPAGAANVLQSPRAGSGLTPADLPFAPDSLIGIRLYENVFESSAPPMHNWKPETGDYRILWSHTVTTRLEPGSAR
jgi:hypothetical protein